MEIKHGLKYVATEAINNVHIFGEDTDDWPDERIAYEVGHQVTVLKYFDFFSPPLVMAKFSSDDVWVLTSENFHKWFQPSKNP